MKKKLELEDILKSTIAWLEIEDVDWESGGRFNNWRNYVDDDFKAIWKELTFREKSLIAYFASIEADKEEWD